MRPSLHFGVVATKSAQLLPIGICECIYHFKDNFYSKLNIIVCYKTLSYSLLIFDHFFLSYLYGLIRPLIDWRFWCAIYLLSGTKTQRNSGSAVPSVGILANRSSQWIDWGIYLVIRIGYCTTTHKHIHKHRHADIYIYIYIYIDIDNISFAWVFASFCQARQYWQNFTSQKFSPHIFNQYF